MVGRDGIEPSTNWLKASCSTPELTARPEGRHYSDRLAPAQTPNRVRAAYLRQTTTLAVWLRQWIGMTMG